MINRKREIYIRINRVTEIVNLLKEIKATEQEIRVLFERYDKLNYDENKVFDNWNNYLEDVIQKLDHITI